MDYSELAKINGLIQTYFEGIFSGDIKKLKSVFNQGALLFGDNNGKYYHKSVSDYLNDVKNRKSPKELGEVFNMKIEGIEIVGDQAVVKAKLPMLGYYYHDFLSLSKVNGDWVIVNKLFSNTIEA